MVRSRVFTLLAAALATAGWIALSATPGLSSSPPSPPRSVRPVAGNGQATVRWVAPNDTGGSKITQYQVAPYINNAIQPIRVFRSSATSEVIVALTNGKPYTFKIAAKNASGWSKLSARSSEITIGAPSPPRNVRAKAGPGQATVSWTAPASSNGAKLSAYRVIPFRAGKAQRAITINNLATSRKITGLAHGTSYQFEVEAHNARDWSPPSNLSPAVKPS